MLAFDRAMHDRDSIEIGVAFDKASSRSFDQYGRMHVKACRISKANVSPYYGKEVPNFKALGLDPQRVYMFYRDPAELKKGADSFRNLQLMMKHVKVTAGDPKMFVTVGTVGGEISFDGTYLIADQLTVWTKEGIRLVETEEAAELSSSYGWRADMQAGVTPEGVAFDGVMRDIKGNHVSLVHSGRVGSDVVVNDALPLELHTMKRPNLLARLILLGVLPSGTFDKEQQVALDEKLSEMTAKDSDPDDEEDDPENPGKKRKKMNPGKGQPGKAGGALAHDEQIATDEQIDAAIIAKGYISKADAEKLAMDARTQASADAVSTVNALHVARKAVEPLVGIVAMDSAEAVYKFALETEKVALDGVPAGAYAALVAQRVSMRKTTPAARSPTTTTDAAAAAASAFPGLGRIQVG